jgi:hypothetical protein
MKVKFKGEFMKKWIIGILIGLGAAGAGIGGAFALNSAYTTQQNTTTPALNQDLYHDMGPGLKQFGSQFGQNGMGGGMWNNRFNQQDNNGTVNSTARITLEDAYTKAEAYVSTLGSNLKIAEIMEFQNNFYVVVTESDSGRGAVELLVDADTGTVRREPGPDMMWNLKYGHMGMMSAPTATDNTVTLDEARTSAQQWLDTEGLNAVLNEGGYSFYGYYSFDYSIDGQTAGMLSVNGLTGQVWYHNWHGTFISEKEY